MDPTAPQTSTVSSVERRLQAKLAVTRPETRRHRPGDLSAPGARRPVADAGRPIVAWGRAWVSHDGRFATIFAARTLDFAVLTEDHLCLVSTGFFTRRPRRRVYSLALDRLHVEECEAKRGRRLRLSAEEHRPLLLDMRRTPRNEGFADQLLARAGPEAAGQ